MSDSKTADENVSDLDACQWLIGPDAAPWLEWAATSTQDLTAKVAHLRAHRSAQQTHLILEQIALRQRARAKFSAAGKMFFTTIGLEQSSDEIVAAHKAGRFAPNRRVFDLCCGIGGDLLALARRGETVGYDRNPVMALMAAANGYAAANLLANGTNFQAPIVRVEDVSRLDMRACAAWHIDPDRRAQGRRTTLVDLHEPGPEVIERLLADNPHGAIKLAPAAQMPEAWRERAELEWISRGRECRQLVAWFGDLARAPGRRSASVLGASAQECRTIIGSGEDDPPTTDRIGAYLFEPDAAVLAAKLSGTLAAEHQLAAIAPGLAYWTGDQVIADLALSCFEIVEVMPFRLKPLKAMLRARGIGQLEIKKRGVGHDPIELRRQLNPSGDKSATLLLTRIAKREIAILAQRVS